MSNEHICGLCRMDAPIRGASVTVLPYDVQSWRFRRATGPVEVDIQASAFK